MKKNILLILLILIIPSVIAGNEYGKITSGGKLLITDVDVKVDDLTSRNLEYGDEINRIANPNSIIKFTIEAKNNHTDLTMEEVEMVIQIENLDLEKTTSSTNINSNKDKTLSLEFTLPSDTEERDYKVFLEIEAQLNDTIHRVEFELDLVVESDEEVTSSSSSGSSLSNQLKTMNQTISDLNKDIGSYFVPYTDCVSERDTLKGQIETKDEKISNLQGFNSRYDTCNSQLTTCEVLKGIYRMANESCYYAIEKVHIPAIEKAKNNTWLAVFITAGLLIGLYYFKQKGWFPEGESEEKSQEAT